MRTYLREAQITYRRVGSLPESIHRNVRNSADVAPIATELIGTRLTESFLVFALDAKNRIIGYHEVSRGSTAACPVMPGDVFRYPIVVGALAIIVAHNHPSGDPTPSDEDVHMTARLRKAGQLLGVQVLDHIVVADSGHTSMLDAGILGCD